MYYSFEKFVIDAYGMFKLSYETYLEYVEYSLKMDVDFFGKNNKHSLRYNYKMLIETLSKNRIA